MKLYDCSCGGIPHVTYKFSHKTKFAVSCPVCEKSTSEYYKIEDAATTWNKIWWEMVTCIAEQVD